MTEEETKQLEQALAHLLQATRTFTAHVAPHDPDQACRMLEQAIEEGRHALAVAREKRA